MKKLIFGLILISSTSIFAEVESLPPITGMYGYDDGDIPKYREALVSARISYKQVVIDAAQCRNYDPDSCSLLEREGQTLADNLEILEESNMWIKGIAVKYPPKVNFEKDVQEILDN